MIGTLAVVFVFGGLIFFHELGHFLAARCFGMGVKTFSLGFGPALVSFKRQKTVYQIAAMPLGGFVSLVGEHAGAEVPEDFAPEEMFHLRPAWQRFCVCAAGSVANFLLAWIICWGLVWANGHVDTSSVVGAIMEDSAAAASPMQVGDRIVSLNDRPVAIWSEISPIVQESRGNALSVVVRRADGSMQSFSLVPTLLKETLPNGQEFRKWGMGIRPAHREYSFFQSAQEGLADAVNMASFIWNALGELVTREVAFDNVGGPILIAQTIYNQAYYGLISLMKLTALISVNLALLNLLPVPVLDGGHLLFLLAEMIFRRPVPAIIQEKATIIGLALLICLMLAATFNDVMRFFS
ncbi:MAG: RIP metalloprotease RseP [Desulfovibrio sp.]|jgi:regulator of sigma E protease|nr:RIP metalloprotease RseP [Desulfovibrio sp.]